MPNSSRANFLIFRVGSPSTANHVENVNDNSATCRQLAWVI